MDEYVIWSIEHQAWWRPYSWGYCDTLGDAGRYTRLEAERIVGRANLVAVHECMIPVTAFDKAFAAPRTVDWGDTREKAD